MIQTRRGRDKDSGLTGKHPTGDTSKHQWKKQKATVSMDLGAFLWSKRHRAWTAEDGRNAAGDHWL